MQRFRDKMNIKKDIRKGKAALPGKEAVTAVNRSLQLPSMSVRERAQASSAVAAALSQVVDNVSYADLSTALQTKFKSAGISGREVAARTGEEATRFYESSVPSSVRALGEDAVRKFIEGKDASHIQSYRNAPELAKTDSNLLWEAASANRSRGAADMTRFEQLQVNLNGGFDTFMVSASEVVPAATMMPASVEAGISIVENTIYVYRGKKDFKTALRDSSVNTAKSAIAGTLTGGALAGAMAIGGAPVIAAAAPVLGVVGGSLLVYTAANRISIAATDASLMANAQELTDKDLLAPLDRRMTALGALKEEIYASRSLRIARR